MQLKDWEGILDQLSKNKKIIATWPPSFPNPSVTRCEFSRHRTLAHLCACQEQWFLAVQEFLDKQNPNATILHPWRKFDQCGYSTMSWEVHMESFLRTRESWLELRSADFNKPGKINRKPSSVGMITQHLEQHESYHIQILKPDA